MLKLHVVQAHFGDSLILEYGTLAKPNFILVDGGPKDIYRRHLRSVLKTIADRGGRLEAMILSHVDTDHTTGLRDFLSELRELATNGENPLIEVDAFWHNAFDDAIPQGADIQARLAQMHAVAGIQNATLSHSGIALFGIEDGHILRQAANAFGLNVNPGFPDQLVLVDTAPRPIRKGNLEITVVGPTRANLGALRDEWIEWLDANEPDFLTPNADPHVLAMADRSIPNLSSIQLLVEADGKRILLTGDGRGDHLLEGLTTQGLLDANGGIHVDLLKAPHHGSDRNVTKTFFKKITADKYVLSADGTHSNPDYATLMWIVETANDAGREIELIVTNKTPSVIKLLKEYPKGDWGYRMTILPKSEDVITIDLSA